MSVGVNKVTLLGNLGLDPEIAFTPKGVQVTSLRIATGKEWTDRDTKEKKGSTEWHSVVAYDPFAKRCGDYLKKGQQIYLEGWLRTQKWKDKEGKDRYKTEIVMTHIQMLGGRTGEPKPASRPAPQQRAAEPPEDDGNEWSDDIPF